MVAQENEIKPLRMINHSIDTASTSLKLYCIHEYPEDEVLQTMISELLYFESMKAQVKTRKLQKKLNAKGRL